MMGFGMMGGGFIGLIVIGVVIYLIVNNSGASVQHNNYHRRNNPKEILDERFAKGEISEEEYLQKKKILTD